MEGNNSTHELGIAVLLKSYSGFTSWQHTIYLKTKILREKKRLEITLFLTHFLPSDSATEAVL